MSTTGTAPTWLERVAARRAELGEPLAAIRAMDAHQRLHAGRLTALALQQSLQATGWTASTLGGMSQNYDAVPGGPGLSSADSTIRAWQHPDHPGIAIRIDVGINHRAATSWGEIRMDDQAGETS
jgi:hypothetical protein